MKNKRILVLALVIVAVLVVSVSITLIYRNSLKGVTDINLSYEAEMDSVLVLDSSTVSELQEKADSCNIPLFATEAGDCFGVNKAFLGSVSLSALFTHDGDNIVKTSGKIEFEELYEGENGSARFEYDLLYALGLCSNVVGADLMESYNIFHNTGYVLDKNDVGVYEQILNGEAFIMVIVKESTDSYWEITGYFDQSGLSVYLERVFENLDAEYADVTLE